MRNLKTYLSNRHNYMLQITAKLQETCWILQNINAVNITDMSAQLVVAKKLCCLLRSLYNILFRE